MGCVCRTSDLGKGYPNENRLKALKKVASERLNCSKKMNRVLYFNAFNLLNDRFIASKCKLSLYSIQLVGGWVKLVSQVRIVS